MILETGVAPHLLLGVTELEYARSGIAGEITAELVALVQDERAARSAPPSSPAPSRRPLPRAKRRTNGR